LDSITSIWVVKTFFSGWEEAMLAFVPAGSTLGGAAPDENPEILHADTGFGKFDHHQSDDDTCAAKLVAEEAFRVRGRVDRALQRLVAVVNDIDHFREVFYPNPTADMWDFSLESLIDGWKACYPNDPLKVVALGMDALDAVYKVLQSKCSAEVELKEKSVAFQTMWGPGIGIMTSNDDAVTLAQKMGSLVVVRKDPLKGNVRIKAVPLPSIDLSQLYEELKKKDPKATWFLHASHHMVLNGSSKNPQSVPSSLSLEEVINTITFVAPKGGKPAV
jgi:hypothetical protein